MNKIVIAAVFLVACGLAFAQTDPGGDDPPTFPIIIVPPDDLGGGMTGGSDTSTPVVLADADRDGFVVTIDCNDANPNIKPHAAEVANGIDDNCDGVVDDGFDTTIDSPRVGQAGPIWPEPTTTALGELVSTGTQPRLLWVGDRFLAVWTDLRHRLRVAQIASGGRFLGPPSDLHGFVKNLDAAWTGTRLGVVYQEEGIAGTPSVRLMTLDREARVLDDVVLAAVGREPKIAWGQDRFGVVWKAPGETNSLRFQRFRVTGEPLSEPEVLVNSGGNAAIVFDGTLVTRLDSHAFVVHEGRFGIAYEARYGVVPSGDVLLSTWPREVGPEVAVGPVRVNAHNDPYSCVGAMPTIASNATGFAVGWHAREAGQDRARIRFLSHDTLEPLQEFTPDLDPARYGRMIWTGGEFVMVNENHAGTDGAGFDVHFRRIDPSGNSHVSAPRGAWTELNLRSRVPGSVSTHPDVANAGDVLGVLWVESSPALARFGGKLWFAIVTHQ